MRIPIRVRYTYRNYPFSTKATNMSRTTAILTSWPMCGVCGFFWFAIIGFYLVKAGLSEDTSYTIALVSLIGFGFIVHKIKQAMNRKIEAAALADLKKLQETNPEEFWKYVQQAQ